jgi:galactan 5-O-arabinofuranosyltransferase
VWRRVLPDLPAALVGSAVCVATLDLVKPDEWLVLCLVLPWWLDVVRGLRSGDRPPVRWWADGAMLGGLLLVHSFYFLPLAVASVVGIAVDALLRRPLPLRPLRALAIGAVGLAVATPYWGPLVWLRLRGLPSDSLQVRWSRPGFEWPPLPGPDHVVGVVGLVGVAWLLWRVRTSPLALSVSVALLSTYAFFLGGQWLQRYDVALLPEKSDELIVALLVLSGVLGLADVARLLLSGGRRRWAPVLVLAAVVATSVAGTVDLTRHWVLGRPALAAQQMRYPDGTFPAGGIPDDPATHRHPWGVSPGDDGPSVDEVRAAWRTVSGGEMGSGTVLVTARADLLATTPVHPFTAWKSIYSHPNGRFLDRVALLRRVSDCATPDCAWRLLRRNDLDRVDGLVLTTTRTGLQLSLTTDVFPDGWVLTPVVFPSELFRGPHFERRDVRGVAVIAVR